MKARSVNIIRGRQPYHCSLYGMIAAKFLKKPFVVSLGGDNRVAQQLNCKYYYNSKFISYALEKTVLMFSDRIICPNEYTKTYVSFIIGAKGANEKCRVVPWLNIHHSTYQKQALSIDDSLNHLASKKIIPIVGFINHYKYSHILFDVLRELYEELLEFKEYVFVFCGDGPLRKDGIERFRTVENVLFPGWVKNVLVNIYISKAKFCLIPMSGYVLLEAASLGKCVVTSNLEWHSELVENEVNGLLVDPESISYWKEAIKKLMLNSIDIDRYGSNLFNKYLKLYSPEIAVRLEQEVYNDLLVQS